MKTAKLYAWVALQTLPEEMVISPCLLDFLEKALETIPITPVDRNYTSMYIATFQKYIVCLVLLKFFFKKQYSFTRKIVAHVLIG